MQNLNIKTLKVIAICLTALIVICMAILLDRSPKRTEQVEIEVVEAINNRERIIHHSGDLYCYTVIPSEDSIQYALLKLPVNFDKNSTRKIIQKYVNQELLVEKEENIFLSDAGIDVSNVIMAEFML